MKPLPGLNRLCSPALAYLVLSLATVATMYFHHLGDPNSYCIGRYTCNVASVSMLYIMKIVYVLFWTWILNILCREQYETVAWILVFIPYLLMLIFILSVFFIR
jgi:hypothetical protein